MIGPCGRFELEAAARAHRDRCRGTMSRLEAVITYIVVLAVLIGGVL